MRSEDAAYYGRRHNGACGKSVFRILSGGLREGQCAFRVTLEQVKARTQPVIGVGTDLRLLPSRNEGIACCDVAPMISNGQGAVTHL